MRTIIRNKMTGQFVAESGWAMDRKLARDFEDLDDALFYRSALPAQPDLQIICQPRDEPSNYDITW
jgi:hypothetical protein